jgi:hypothetical protein
VTDRAEHRLQSDGVPQNDRVPRLTRAAVAIDSPSAGIILAGFPRWSSVCRVIVKFMPSRVECRSTRPRRLAQRGLPGLIDGGVDPE